MKDKDIQGLNISIVQSMEKQQGDHTITLYCYTVHSKSEIFTIVTSTPIKKHIGNLHSWKNTGGKEYLMWQNSNGVVLLM